MAITNPYRKETPSENSIFTTDTGTGATSPSLPPGAQQIQQTIESFMPMIETTTGLTRREISLQLLKTGFKGGNLLDVITGLSGTKPAPEAKFVKYVKTFAVWVPVFIGLCGGIIIFLYALLLLTRSILGGL